MARKDEAPLTQIAKDFGLSGATLKRYIAIADRKGAGANPESAEMRELKKRNRFLEQEK